MSSQFWSVQALRRRATAQAEALQGLAASLTEEAEHLRRRAQAERLRALKKRVSEEVISLWGTERAARQGYDQGKLIGAGLNFAVGGLFAAATGRGGNPLVVGARWAGRALESEAPFGKLVVAIGPGGMPDDVRVVCLSSLARESERTEYQVAASLGKDGSTLMTPETFATSLDEIERRVLDGTLSLPVAASQLPPGTGRQAP